MLVTGILISVGMLVSVYYVVSQGRNEITGEIIAAQEPVPAQQEPAADLLPVAAVELPAPAAVEPPPVVPTQLPAPAAPKLQPAAPPAAAVPVQPAAPVQQTPVQQAPASVQQAPKKINSIKLVFVIDDAGNNLRDLEPYLRFPGSLTIAVLPGLPNSAEAARRIRAAGKEVLLHQPMESLGGSNPGPKAIYSAMSEAEIRSVVNSNLDEVWPVAGINNHEGSKISMDEKIMEIILDICRERGIFFLDSRTTADTAAPEAAIRLGVEIGERDVFLDNDHDRNSIISYLDSGLAKAAQKGNAVMIGHVSTDTLASILNEFYPGWIDRGYTLSTVSGIMEK